MRYISHDFGDDIKEIRIAPISDLHVGSPFFEEKLARAFLKELHNQGAYFLLLGDLMNSDIKSSKGDVYSEILTPQQQLDLLTAIFSEYKDRILGIVSGNHELRIEREVGVDVMSVFAQLIGKQNVYDKDIILLNIRFGKQLNGKKTSYHILAIHGWTSARTIGGKMNPLYSLRNVALADCYIVAHTHWQGVFKEGYILPEPKNKKTLEIEQVFVNSGSFQKWASYAQRTGRPLNVLGSPIICLRGDTKHISILI